MKRVAITGVSGYIGSRLLKRLAQAEGIERIVGIDIKPAPESVPGLKFYRQNIFEPLDRIFIENEVESAVHLAFVLRPTRDRAGASRIDIGGSQNFLNACHAAKVGHIVYLSSHTVYGAHRDNPVPLDEGSPLRPLFDFQYSWDKVETERLLREFAQAHPGVALTILRSCPVVGKGAANSVAALMFKPPVIIAVKGYDPPMQFVHEDDVVELMVGFLSERRNGTYNVAGGDPVCYSEVARLARRRMLSLPESLLRCLMGLSWRLHLQNDSPPSGLEFIKYPPVISTEKLTKETSFTFRYSSSEAISAFLDAADTL